MTSPRRLRKGHALDTLQRPECKLCPFHRTIYNPAYPLGKGEVLSSILSGSTISVSFAKRQHANRTLKEMFRETALSSIISRHDRIAENAHESR
jgi:hypothetical protein